MKRAGAYLVVIATATILVAVSVSSAKKQGADPRFSGSRDSGGAGCTACHPFNEGMGWVELLGTPRRYRPGMVYELTVRISDPDPDQDGAGFEISAETVDGEHEGTLRLIPDDTDTRYAGKAEQYVTHTRDGVDNSIAGWMPSRSYDYHLEWEAPSYDAGPITFFTASLSLDTEIFVAGTRYYATYTTSHYARPGDGDGDDDVDQNDFALMWGCLTSGDKASAPGCECVDFDSDGDVRLDDVGAFMNAFSGPTATLPAGYVLADPVRGGLLYDKWWKVNDAAEPTGSNHPLYPGTSQQSGSTTYRCKECHGWDYKGRDGAYGSGSHYTGIVGVWNTVLTPQQLFDLLKADAPEAGGHDMDAFGLDDPDLWDLVKMVFEGAIDTDEYIDGTGAFLGDSGSGYSAYFDACASCHGAYGTDIDFGDEANPIYIGTLANGNPWEFLHKTRFGHPASPMPSLDLIGWEVTRAADIGAYSATLPE